MVELKERFEMAGYNYYWMDEPAHVWDGPAKKARPKIEVAKGRVEKARYAIFYAITEDPVIFCKTMAEAKREVAKLKKNPDVQKKSIKIFKLCTLK